MSWLLPIGYGVVSAIGFFGYLCWFRHVRDTTPSRTGKLLYYFLIALSFVLLGRLTGIVVAVGVVPMLVILLFLPKTGYSLAVKLSVIYGLAVCFVYYGRAADEERQALSHSQAILSNEYVPPFDFDAYFQYEDLNRSSIQFNSQNIEFDDFALIVPLPDEYVLAQKEIVDDQKSLYAIDLTKNENMKITLLIQGPGLSQKGFAVQKREIYTETFSPDFLSYFEKRVSENNALLVIDEMPKVVHNTDKLFCIYMSDKIELKNTDETKFSERVIGNVMISNNSLYYHVFTQSTTRKKTKHLLLSWLNELVRLNSK